MQEQPDSLLPDSSELTTPLPSPFSKIATALAKAQGAMEQPKLDSKAVVKLRDNKGSYTFRYSSLAECLRVLQKPLADNELFMQHDISTDGATVTVHVIVYHSSGQMMCGSSVSARAASADPQAIGSVVTYMRRYTLHAFFGMAAVEDDDGNSGQGNEAEIIAPQPTTEKGKKKLKQREKYEKLTIKLDELIGVERASKLVTAAKDEHGTNFDAILTALDNALKIETAQKDGKVDAVPEDDDDIPL